MRRLVGVILVAGLVACAPAQTEPANLEQIPTAQIAAQRGEISFEELAPGIWMHTSYKRVESWGDVVSHGMIVERGDHAVLIDSAWNDAQTTDILDWAEQDLGQPITLAVFTHAHSDKMGGVDAIRLRGGIRTLAHQLSNANAPWHGVSPAEEDLPLGDIGASTILDGLEIFYPGGGHTQDNIVVYDPENRLLFGGCLIRPGPSDNLGNTNDADLGYWAQAIANVDSRFPDATIVLPSHGDPAGRDLLNHTQLLATDIMED